jgi:aromatic ring-cleaving dioxygenase
MPAVQQTARLLLAVLALVDAHPHPVSSEENCTCEPGARPFESYHIHVLFYPDLQGTDEFGNNTHASKFARSLRKAFIEHFDVPECDASGLFNLTTLCAFPVDEEGKCGVRNAAPFVVPNFVFFVPVDRYVDTVPWMMANRGDLDFLVHPNSCGFTCSPQDHLHWSVWGGNQWPVRFDSTWTPPSSSQLGKAEPLMI